MCIKLGGGTSVSPPGALSGTHGPLLHLGLGSDQLCGKLLEALCLLGGRRGEVFAVPAQTRLLVFLGASLRAQPGGGGDGGGGVSSSCSGVLNPGTASLPTQYHRAVYSSSFPVCSSA